MKLSHFCLQTLLVYMLVGSSQAQLREQGGRKDRAVSGFSSETAKHLSSAYVGFYNRHDSAGCMHTGLALASLSNLQISAQSAEIIKDKLTQARQYCLDDRVPRAQVIKVVRDSLKIINGHSLVTTD